MGQLKVSPSLRQLESPEELADSPTQILPMAPIPPAEPLEGFVRQRTTDPICANLALECDRLDLVLRDSWTKKSEPAEAATIISRRVSTLRALAERMDSMENRNEAGVEVTAMATVLRIVKETLRNSTLSPETRELVFQEMLGRVQSERKGMKSDG